MKSHIFSATPESGTAKMMQALSYLLGEPPLRGRIRVAAEDFRVDEILDLDAAGEGEHLLVSIRKKGANTQYVAQQLARLCGVPVGDVSYSGLKDRHAITTQWFSVRVPGKDAPALAESIEEGVDVLNVLRHNRKLRRGTHRANAFGIVLRDVEGDRDAAEARLTEIKSIGFPNYFAEQRFGRDFNNIVRARELFGSNKKIRKKDGMLVSAARSWLFNRVVSARLHIGGLDRVELGDVVALSGSNSVFTVSEDLEDIHQRIAEGDLLVTGPLWGNGKTMTSADVHAWECSCLSGDEVLVSGLENSNLRHERRVARVLPRELSWQWLDPQALRIRFELPSGSYATGLLRELLVSY